LSKTPAPAQVRDLVLDQDLSEFIFDLTTETKLIDLFFEQSESWISGSHF
jgi:hypothetical protein